MTEEQMAELEAILNEIAAMSDEDTVAIYLIKNRIENLVKNEIKNYAKGYSRQIIIEQLNEMVDILDARISMQLIADGEWDPEVEPQRPTVNENGIGVPNTPNTPNTPNNPVNPPVNGGNDNATEEPEQLGFFARIIQAIIAFFQRLFGKI